MEKDDRQLLSKAIRDDELDWKPYHPGQEKDNYRSAVTTVTGRVNMAGICALSRRLIAIERARALGRKPVDVQMWALELETRRWAEERARRLGDQCTANISTES